MGLFLSRSFSRAGPSFSFVSFFVLSESPFLRPDPPRRHHANTVGLGQQNDDQRGARVRARIYRATTLYSVGPRTRTMMQSYASVAKLVWGFFCQEVSA